MTIGATGHVPRDLCRRMRDAEHLVALGGQEADDRLAMARLGAAQDRIELRRSAQAVEPGVAGHAREAEESVFDDLLEQRERAVAIAEERHLPADVEAPLR